MTENEIKAALLEHCKETVQKRLQKIKQTINDIDESLLEESKSSSGDKHETGRAMLQIDRENAGKQLREIEPLQEILRKIDIKAVSDYARLGSLIFTDKAIYFISISAGEVTIGESTYFCVALQSPIGALLLGKKKEEHFLFNEKSHKITAVN